MKINDQHIIALDSEDQVQFRWRGCYNCDNGLGNDVYECKAYTAFNPDDYYEVYLCHSCLCAYHNGDELDEECKDRFEV